jgi:hypothetical protein
MSKTIGRHWPRNGTGGDYTDLCAYCGAKFRRSEMTRLRNGLLACDWDATGRDEVTLDLANAASVPHSRQRRDNW